MTLDQYLLKSKDDLIISNTPMLGLHGYTSLPNSEKLFVWFGRRNLHTYMALQFRNAGIVPYSVVFNYEYLEVTFKHIQELFSMIRKGTLQNLFQGVHSVGDNFKDEDKAIIVGMQKALKAMDEDYKIYYYAWY